MGNIFDLLIVNPLMNALMLLYGLFGNSYVLAILALTVIIRLITLPLTLRQQIGSYKMQAMQPKMKELQEKYKNDPQTLSVEMRKLGFNPLSGCLPLVIQFPILIGLYQAITRTLALTPLSLMELGSHVYSFLPNISSLVPINSNLFGLFDLGQPDKLFIIPVLVVISTYFSNKLMTPPSTDPQMRQTNQMMQMMMPLMFGFFMLSTPVGLGIYWIVSNLIGVAQYYLTKPQLDKAKALHAGEANGGSSSPGGSPPAGDPSKPLFEPPKSKVRVKSTGRVNQSATQSKNGALANGKSNGNTSPGSDRKNGSAPQKTKEGSK